MIQVFTHVNQLKIIQVSLPWPCKTPLRFPYHDQVVRLTNLQKRRNHPGFSVVNGKTLRRLPYHDSGLVICNLRWVIEERTRQVSLSWPYKTPLRFPYQDSNSLHPFGNCSINKKSSRFLCGKHKMPPRLPYH